MIPLRLLLITNSLSVGGVETNLVALAQAFQRRGHRVTVAAARGPLCELLGEAIDYAEIPGDRLALWELWRAASEVGRLVREREIDVIHAFSPRATLICDLAKHQRIRANGDGHRWPLLISVPGGLQESPTEWPMTTYCRLLPITRADHILIISEEIRRAVRGLPGASSRMVELCHIGLDLQRFHPNGAPTRQHLRAELGWPPESRLIATIGACVPRKSHELFVRAAGLVVQEYPNARFLVIGEGRLRPELTALAKGLGLQDIVRFLGLRLDVPEIMANLDVYIKPGIVEGFIGITVLEAMAMAKPVIAFETEDVKVAIRHDETGLVVPRGDVSAMSRAILRVLTEPDLAEKFGRAGRRLVEQEFEVMRVAERLEQFYRGALAC